MRFIHTVKMSQPKLPMILMSGELQQPQTRAGTIPCDRFFHKPFLPKALLEVVEECLVPEFEFCD